jgi:hypothetical protein
MASSGMLRRVADVRNDVSEGLSDEYGGDTFLRNVVYYKNHTV